MYEEASSDPGAGDVQVAPFWHGPLPSLLSQPVPSWHVPPRIVPLLLQIPPLHIPPFRHRGVHASDCLQLQTSPTHPSSHAHDCVWPSNERHLPRPQSALSQPVPVWQRSPAQPFLQSHLYEEASSDPGAGDVQVAPFLHGPLPSSLSQAVPSWQLSPVQPFVQWHLCDLGSPDPGAGDVQVAPCWHGPFPPLLSQPVAVWQKLAVQPSWQLHLNEEPSPDPGAGDVQFAPC